jgi:hypothetical protein
MLKEKQKKRDQFKDWHLWRLRRCGARVTPFMFSREARLRRWWSYVGSRERANGVDPSPACGLTRGSTRGVRDGSWKG